MLDASSTQSRPSASSAHPLQPSTRGISFFLALWAFCQPLSISASGIAELGLIIALLDYARRAKRLPFHRSSLAAPLWLYFGAALLSCLFSQDRAVSFHHLRSDVHKLAVLYVFLIAFSLENKEGLARWWARGFAAAAALGILQVALLSFPASMQHALFDLGQRWHSLQWLQPAPRAHGGVHFVDFGELMAMALLGGLAYAAQEKRISRGLGVYFLLTGCALILSETRGAWAGLPVGIAVLLRIVRSRKVFRLAATIAGTGLALLLLLVLFDRLSFLHPQFSLAWRLKTLLRPDNFSTQVREEAWKVAWRMFLDHPWTGVGLNNYATLFGKYHSLPFFGEVSFGNPHDLYLCQLSERGLVGLAALMFLLGTLTVRSVQLCREKPHFLSLWSAIWLPAFLVMNITQAAFQFEMLWAPTIILFCWAESLASMPVTLGCYPSRK